MSGRRVKKAVRRTFYGVVQSILPLRARDALRAFLLRQDPVARREQLRLQKEQAREAKLAAKREHALHKAQKQAIQEVPTATGQGIAGQRETPPV